MRRVSKCPCGHPVCRDYHVDHEAALQGVKFTLDQALAVAAVLDALDGEQGRVRVAEAVTGRERKIVAIRVEDGALVLKLEYS